MKKITFGLYFLFSSLILIAQKEFEGKFKLLLGAKAERLGMARLVDIKYDIDTVRTGKYKWEISAIERDTMLVWKFEGYGTTVGSNVMNLYVENYWDYRPKHVRKVNRKINKKEPFFILEKEAELFFIKHSSKKRVLIQKVEL